MLQRLAWIFGVLAFAYGLPAGALGLGSIEVQSHLNQPFSAVISLYSLTEEDASSLQVQLAPASEFEKANINRSEYLSGLRFTVTGGRVKVTGDQPVRDPFLNLLVEAKAGGSRVLRSYTILFDPPGIAAAPAPAAPAAATAPAAPTAVKKPATTEFYQTAEEAARAKAANPTAAPAAAVTPAPAPVAVAPPGPPPVPATTSTPVAPAAVPAPKPSPAVPAPPSPAAATAVAPPVAAAVKSGPAAATSYGPVKAGQTFWNVANLMRPSNSVSVDQTLLAIYEANPSAFVGGFNGLLVGSTLRIPSEEQMRSVPADTARSRVMELRRGSNAQSSNVAAVPEKAPAIAAAPVVRKPVVAPPMPEPVTAPIAKPVPEPKPAVASKPVPVPAPETVNKPAAATVVAPPAAAPVAPIPAPAAPAKPAEVVQARPEPAVESPAPAPTPQAASSLDQQAAPPPPAETVAPVDAGAENLEPIDASSGQAIRPYIPALIVAAVVFAIVLVLMGLRRRRHTETFRRDSIQDYIRSEPPMDAAGIKPAASGPVPASPLGGLRPGTRNEPSMVAATPASEPVAATAPKQPPAADAPAIRPSRSAPLLSAPPIVEAPVIAVPVEVPPPVVVKPVEPVVEPVVLVQAPAPAAPVQAALPEFDLAEPPVPVPAVKSKQTLNSDDPLRQADFHLSYGLYDEAVRCLMTALMRSPERQDLAIKLAETYFAAGRPADFESLAEGLRNRVSATEWEALAEMGAQLCPGSALFAAPNLPAAPVPPAPAILAPAPESKPVPVAVVEPAVIAPVEPLSAPVAAPESLAPRPVAEEPIAARPVDIRPEPRNSDLRFDVRSDLRAEPRMDARAENPAEPRFKTLLDLLADAPASDPTPVQAPAPARPEPQPEMRAQPPVMPSQPTAEVRADNLRREPRFDTGGARQAPRIDSRIEPGMSNPSPPIVEAPIPPPAAESGRPELRLEPTSEPLSPRREPRAAEVASLPFNLSPPPSGRREPQMGAARPAGPEESAVKLDLARAYIDMGDIRTARTLLLEVSEQGNLVQQADARGLLSSLPG